MASSGFFTGKPQWQQLAAISPQQQGAQNSILSQMPNLDISKNPLYGQVGDYYSKLFGGGESDAYNKFSAPYLQQFQEQTVPQLSNQFGHGVGAEGSSAFQKALGKSATNLHTGLAGLFEGLKGQQAQNAVGYLGAPSQAYQPYQQAAFKSPFGYQQEGNSLLEQLLVALGGGVGKGLGGGFF